MIEKTTIELIRTASVYPNTLNKRSTKKLRHILATKRRLNFIANAFNMKKCKTNITISLKKLKNESTK